MVNTRRVYLYGYVLARRNGGTGQPGRVGAARRTGSPATEPGFGVTRPTRKGVPVESLSPRGARGLIVGLERGDGLDERPFDLAAQCLYR